MATESPIAKNPESDRSKLLRINEVIELTTLSRSCLALWVAQGRFPKPAILSSTVKVWRASDIANWVDEHFKNIVSTPNETVSCSDGSSAEVDHE